MSELYGMAPDAHGAGTFAEAPVHRDADPGRGRTISYRVEVEDGLGLDAGLFAEAVQRTLDDARSWAGKGKFHFRQTDSRNAEFVITLASPGTTAAWCAKSGLDTTVSNVSCDSASTKRIMINAFRWAQGSPTFGPEKIFEYRQMLINHEVGHRIGHRHQNCGTPGTPAPVMQQQTKSLTLNGISCRPNPWPYPDN
ncbi:DUF3152 domain-containing protein [Streptomyces sp. NPDC006487]|uniref:DUF3152 domain-containing protein n=1 Tax=Streptomyces sp. NPDC006487 TaxID=3364748 RepID=UPI00368140B9